MKDHATTGEDAAGHHGAHPHEDAQSREHGGHEHDHAAEHSAEDAHAQHAGHDEGRAQGGGHGAHVDHSGHEQMFRHRFWVCLVLSIPVLLYSPMLQDWFGFTMPAFPGSEWIGPLFAIVVFSYGGMPFLQMAVPEIRNREPGMMTLISLAITVAFVYSLAALVIDPGGGFFWELVTLIDVMLLGHWLEMRSVRQASGALDELAKLMPDTAERIRDDGGTEEVQRGRAAARRSGAGAPRRQRAGRRRGRGGRVRRQRGDDHRRIEAGDEGAGRRGDRRHDQRRRQPARAGDGHRRRDGAGRHHAPGRGGAAEQVAHADSWPTRPPAGSSTSPWAWPSSRPSPGSLAVGFNVEVVDRVATVLVIACPHALGLAVPLVVAISTSLAANNGILVRDRLALEEAREIDTVIFDKTGTLTKGEFGVVGMATVEGWSEDEALALTAAVEGDSEHIIARGIRQRGRRSASLALPDVADFEAIKGRGVRGNA